MRGSRLVVPFVVLILYFGGFAGAEEVSEKAAAPAVRAGVPPGWDQAVSWRSIGPASMGGRITALAVYEKDPTRWWAATASGGLLKTENNGQTFTHQFDRESVVSIGDVAVAQSDPNIVWVGTGESNPRNSVSWGNGVYKSVDGGATWKHMGLKHSFQIGAVRIHPTDPNVVYVGALGRLWGENPERGLYKTTDGGASWTQVHKVDDKTGVIDVAMSPADPDTLLVATYERQRDEFCTNDPAKRFGPGAALWRTTDGGATFTKVTAGLPTCELGRIGLCFSRKNPSNVFMVLESKKLGQAPKDSPYLGINGEDADVGCRLTRVVPKGPAAKSKLKKDDIVLGLNGARVHDYAEFIRLVRGYVAGDVLKLEVVRERQTLEIDLTLGKRPKGGRSPFSAYLGGQQPNLQDQQGKDGHEHGGVYKSTDAGVTWTRINSLNPRPMYFSRIRVDPTDESKLWVLGIRLWRSRDGGKTFTPDGHGGSVHVDHHALWINPTNGRHVVLGNDGGLYTSYDDAKHWDHLNHVAIGQFYHVGVDHRDGAYFVYGGLQDNGSWGGPSRVRTGAGPTNQDWFRVGGGDGFRCLVDPHDPDQIYFQSQNGGIGRRHLASGERAGFRPRPARGSKEKYRFNWYAPYQLSHHNSRIYYVAGNHVWRSLDRGERMKKISPEITYTKRGSATAFGESPRDSDLLYVGTDDGALWLTRDGGHTWVDLYAPPKPDVVPAAPKRPQDVSSSERAGDGAEGDDGAAPKKADEPAELVDRFVGQLMAMDADGDGKLKKSEVPARLEGFFDRSDANKDGFVTREELRATILAKAEEDAAVAAGAGKAKKSPGQPLHLAQPDRRYVSWIEPSRFKTARAYVAFDAHRSNDDRALVFVTEDAGKTWTSIEGDLPASAGTTRHLREDPKNENVLWLGTEMGAWVSLDRGAHWMSLNTNLPTVAVHAFAFHPASGEVVAGTHGRSLWIMDASELRQMNTERLESAVHLFRPAPTVMWRPLPGRGRAKTFFGENPKMGGSVLYHLKQGAKSVDLKVVALDGRSVRSLESSTEAGFHRVRWDLRRDATKGASGRTRQGRRVAPGTYRVELEVDGKSYTQPIVVRVDPEHSNPEWIAHADREEAENAERAIEKWKRKYGPWKGDD